MNSKIKPVWDWSKKGYRIYLTVDNAGYDPIIEHSRKEYILFFFKGEGYIKRRK